MTNNLSVYFKPWSNIRQSTSSVTVASADQPEYSQLGRTSAQMMCWMWPHWTDPERLWQAFSKLCPCWTSVPTSHSQIRQPVLRSFRRNNIHSRRNSAFVRSIPAVFPQHSYPYPRIPRDSRCPHPMHTSSPNATNPICWTYKNCSYTCKRADDCEHCVTQSSIEQFW